MGLEQELVAPNRDSVLRALGIDPELLAAFKAGAPTDFRAEPGRAVITVGEAARSYVARRHAGDSKTDQTYRHVLDLFLRFLADQHGGVPPDSLALDQITRTVIVDFVVKPKRNGLPPHPRTQNRNLSIISAWLRDVVRDGHLSRNPAQQIDRAPEPRSAPKALTEDEQQSVLDWSRQSVNGLRNHTIINLTLNTGLRAQEVCNLKWCDIDFEAGTLKVVAGKGQRDRTIPILPDLGEALIYYRNVCRRTQLAAPGAVDCVFVNTQGRRWGHPMTVRGLEEMLTPLLRRLEKPKGCKFHILRHSFAVNLLWRGVHIAVIAALLGHRSFETTQRYLLLGDPSVARALTSVCPDGVVVPRIRRQLTRDQLSAIVDDVFEEDTDDL